MFACDGEKSIYLEPYAYHSYVGSYVDSYVGSINQINTQSWLTVRVANSHALNFTTGYLHHSERNQVRGELLLLSYTNNLLSIGHSNRFKLLRLSYFSLFSLAQGYKLFRVSRVIRLRTEN